MSHYLTYVLIPSDAEEIEATVANLLAPYDENLEVDEYETACQCRRLKARRRATEMVEKELGKITEPEGLLNARTKAEYKQIAWWYGLIANRSEVEKLIREQLLKTEDPDPDCFYCDGTGIRRTRFNPKGRFDWWQIGRTSIEPFADCSKDYPEIDYVGYIAPVKTLDLNTVEIPNGIVTPDGTWHERGTRGAFGIYECIKPDWHLTAIEILEQHKDKLLVVVDYHSTP